MTRSPQSNAATGRRNRSANPGRFSFSSLDALLRDKPNNFPTQLDYSELKPVLWSTREGKKTSLLHLAAQYGRLGPLSLMMRALSEAEASDAALYAALNTCDNNGKTPLAYALSGGVSRNDTGLHLVHATVSAGEHYETLSGPDDYCDLAIALGARFTPQRLQVMLNEPGERRPLLHYAVISGNPKLVDWALTQGASPLIADSRGLSARQLANDLAAGKYPFNEVTRDYAAVAQLLNARAQEQTPQTVVAQPRIEPAAERQLTPKPVQPSLF